MRRLVAQNEKAIRLEQERLGTTPEELDVFAHHHPYLVAVWLEELIDEVLVKFHQRYKTRFSLIRTQAEWETFIQNVEYDRPVPSAEDKDVGAPSEPPPVGGEAKQEVR